MVECDDVLVFAVFPSSRATLCYTPSSRWILATMSRAQLIPFFVDVIDIAFFSWIWLVIILLGFRAWLLDDLAKLKKTPRQFDIMDLVHHTDGFALYGRSGSMVQQSFGLSLSCL